MGEAREVMDAITAAALANDFDALRKFYAPDAVAVDPALGEVTGEGIIELFRFYAEPITGAGFEAIAKHEAGGVAIDEGYLTGTNTKPIRLASGETVPATGRSIRLRSCDVVTVKDGLAVRHHFYYDQAELLSQLGLAPESAAV